MERKVIESGSVRAVVTTQGTESTIDLFVEENGKRVDSFDTIEAACAISALKRALEHFENRRRSMVFDAINRSLL